MEDTLQKRLVAALVAAAGVALALGLLFSAIPAQGTVPTIDPGDNCPDLSSGKINTTGDPATVEVSAPDGYLIDYYCVKAGQPRNGGGSVIILVDPPQQTVIVDHPGKDSVSHYSVHWITAPTTTSTSSTTTSQPTTTISVESTTSSSVAETTTTSTTSQTTTTDPTTTSSVESTTSSTSTETSSTDSPTTTDPELPFTGGPGAGFLVAVGSMLLGLGYATLRGSRIAQE